MRWNFLNGISQIQEIKKTSAVKDILIFKHSIHCSISAIFFADAFLIHHKSLQIIIWRDRLSLYDSSNFDICIGKLKATPDFHGDH